VKFQFNKIFEKFFSFSAKQAFRLKASMSRLQRWTKQTRNSDYKWSFTRSLWSVVVLSAIHTHPPDRPNSKKHDLSGGWIWMAEKIATLLTKSFRWWTTCYQCFRFISDPNLQTRQTNFQPEGQFCWKRKKVFFADCLFEIFLKNELFLKKFFRKFVFRRFNEILYTKKWKNHI